MQKIKNFIKKYKWWIIIVFSILILFLIFKPKNKKQDINPYTVKKENIQQIIDVSGNVSPASEVDLIFEKTGKVISVNVKTGDKVYPGTFLASVNNSDLLISLEQAKNNVLKEETKLTQLKNGLTNEEKVVQENNLRNSENSFHQAENNLFDSLDSISIQVDNIVRGKIDQFFQNGNGLNPTLKLVASGYNVGCCSEEEKLSLNQQRRDIQTNISNLNEYIYKVKQEGITEYNLELVENELKTIKTFVDNVASGINDAQSTDASLASTINSWKSTMSTARTSMTSLVSSLISSENSYYTAKNNYDLAQSNYTANTIGATQEEITIQEIALSNAENNVKSIQDQINKTRLYSPIKGTVSRVDLTKGEQAPSDVAIVISSDSVYQVDVLVSETDAVKISLNNKANVILDAYTESKEFVGKVVELDRSEVLEDGVVSYNTKIQFTTEEKLLSGLTADVEIITQEKENVLAIPVKYISYNKDQKIVKILTKEGVKEQEIKTGTEGETNIEILEGLKENDQIVLPSVTLKKASVKGIMKKPR